jgi:hypothetical protein
VSAQTARRGASPAPPEPLRAPAARLDMLLRQAPTPPSRAHRAQSAGMITTTRPALRVRSVQRGALPTPPAPPRAPAARLDILLRQAPTRPAPASHAPSAGMITTTRPALRARSVRRGASATALAPPNVLSVLLGILLCQAPVPVRRAQPANQAHYLVVEEAPSSAPRTECPRAAIN